MVCCRRPTDDLGLEADLQTALPPAPGHQSDVFLQQALVLGPVLARDLHSSWAAGRQDRFSGGILQFSGGTLQTFFCGAFAKSVGLAPTVHRGVDAADPDAGGLASWRGGREGSEIFAQCRDIGKGEDDFIAVVALEEAGLGRDDEQSRISLVSRVTPMSERRNHLLVVRWTSFSDECATR